MSNARVTIIQPARRWRLLSFKELWFYRDLIKVLAGRSIKLRYKQTAIGVVWVILQPLIAAAILAVVFGRLGGLPDEGAPYLLIVYAAMLPWTIFSQIIQRGGPSIVADRAIVTNIYFPREILPLSHSFSVLLDFSVALVFMMLLMAVYGHAPHLGILLLPVLAVVTVVLAGGIVLALSALNVYFRDVGHMVPFIIQTLLYASPVAYSVTLIPEAWRSLYLLNPVAGIIEGFRWALLGGRDFPLLAVVMATVVSLVTFVFGSLIFQRLERGFADVI